MVTELANGRANTPITIGGITRTAQEWSEVSGVSYKTIWRRWALGYSQRLLLSGERAYRGHVDEAWQGANDLPYADDVMAQVLVNGKGEMTLEEIGICLGMSRERARQIIKQTVSKVIVGMKREGWTRQEFAAWLFGAVQRMKTQRTGERLRREGCDPLNVALAYYSL